MPKPNEGSLDAIQESELRLGPGEDNEDEDQIETAAVNESKLQFVFDKDLKPSSSNDGESNHLTN